jgi:hypothetical protein
MPNEFRQHGFGLLFLLTLSLTVYGLVKLSPPSVMAHAASTPAPLPTPRPTPQLHEANHHLQGAVYTTTDGWASSLLLLNTEGKPVTAHVTLHDMHGRSLNIAPITLEPYKNNSWNIADWISNKHGFETGSLTVTFYGLSMGLHAQETVTNREHSLSFDVHFEEAMEFMSSSLDGLWWALDDHTEARVFIANTKETQTVVTPIFYVEGVEHQGDLVVLNGHASDYVDIDKELKKLNLSAAQGGISLSYTNGPGAIAVVGVIRNKHTGFSTTMRFVDHGSGMTTSLHGANIMIGLPTSTPGFPSTARFTPHVIVRNTTAQAVGLNARIRYTLFDQLQTTDIVPVMLGANEVRALDMSPAINAIGDNRVTDAGIEIEHTGPSGAVMAYATSIEQNGGNAFDVPIKDPMDMGFKGGGNPWLIDGDNRAILHVKNVNRPDGEKHEFVVTLYYDGGTYNLPVQSVEAGQTAEIDIKRLRDDQVKDGSGNLIPLSVTHGQLYWFPRARKGDFVGRMVQYNPVAGTSSSFSCSEPCWCGPDFDSGYLVPGSYNGVPGDIFAVDAYEVDMDCHGWPHGPYHVYANFGTINTDVAFVLGQNYVYLYGGGTTDVVGAWESSYTADETCNQWDWASGWCVEPVCDEEPVYASALCHVTSNTVDIQLNGNTVTGQTIDVVVGQQMNLTTLVQPSNATVANSQWTVPGGDSDRIANYAPSSSSAAPPTTLTSFNNSSVLFYWISTGNGRTVQYTANVNGKSVQAQVTFNVSAPSPATPTVSLPTGGQLSINNFTGCANNSGGPFLVFGNLDPTSPAPGCAGTTTGYPGIIFTPPTTSTPPGSFLFVQLVTGDQITYTYPSGSPSPLNCTATNTPGLDGTYPYPYNNVHTATDAPQSSLPSIYASSTRNFAATMYLMWQSNTSGSIPVPMGSTDWSFSGSTTQSNGIWSTPSGSGSNQSFVAASGISSFPHWSGVVGAANNNCH